MTRNLITKGFKFISDSDYRFKILASQGLYNGLDDRIFLEKYYKSTFHKALDLQSPKTFNEKLQWLKLYDRRPEYTMLVDKYKVRDYIAQKIGEEYLIPLLGVWEDPDDINFKELPNRFVLKCNHNSGLGMCICKDKSKLNINEVKKKLKKGLSQDYYLTGREWPYKDVPRKIIAEKFISDNKGNLTDYKFFCFNGAVDCVMLCTDRESGNTKFYFFDRYWNLCRYNIRGKNAPKDFTLPKPNHLEKMFLIAEKLSQGIPFVRVDLYNVDGIIYFGEMTFFPQSGFDKNLLIETDKYFGDLICLERVKK